MYREGVGHSGHGVAPPGEGAPRYPVRGQARVQVGALAFLIGAYLGIIEVSNTDLKADVKAWELSDSSTQGPRPTLALWPYQKAHAHTEFVSASDAVIQGTGAVLYVLGTASQAAFTHAHASAAATRWLETAPYFAGGACFVVGGYLYAVEAAHSWLWALLPPPAHAARDVGRWIQYLNFFGSLAFFVGGVVGVYESEREVGALAEQLATGLTFLLGSVLFLIQAVLLWLESVNPAM